MVKSHHEKASHNHDRQPLPGPKKKKHTHTSKTKGWWVEHENSRRKEGRWSPSPATRSDNPRFHTLPEQQPVHRGRHGTNHSNFSLFSCPLQITGINWRKKSCNPRLPSVVFAGDLQQNCWRIFLRFCARSEVPLYAAVCAFRRDENTDSRFPIYISPATFDDALPKRMIIGVEIKLG